MSRFVFTTLLVLQLSMTLLLGQNKECRQKPKRFPSTFSHMSSDYANINLQADVLPNRFYQFETSLLFGALFRTTNGQKYYGYNSNLIRIGMKGDLEIRAEFSVPGSNVALNSEGVNHLSLPLGIGIKKNLLAESSATPGLAITFDYVYYNLESHIQTSLVIDKRFLRFMKFSLSAGPQFSTSGTSKLMYSFGVQMKERNHKLGVYALVSDRYHYMQNVFHMGLLLSDNLNYYLTCGYGVHQDHGLFMFSYSGLLNYSVLQSKYGAYFSK